MRKQRWLNATVVLIQLYFCPESASQCLWRYYNNPRAYTLHTSMNFAVEGLLLCRFPSTHRLNSLQGCCSHLPSSLPVHIGKALWKSLFLVEIIRVRPRNRHYSSDFGRINCKSLRWKILYTTGRRANIELRLTIWRHKMVRWPASEHAIYFQDGGALFAFFGRLSG